MSTRLRALPVTPPPMHAETIGSHPNRLTDANRLPVQYLSILLGHNRHHRRDDNRTSHPTPDTVLRLSALTGSTPAKLSHAIPTLAVISELAEDTPRPVSDQKDDVLRRPACRYCMARRGVHGLVVRNIPSHEAACLRHHRRLLGEDPHGGPRRPSSLRIELVTYPEPVKLTALLASPHWHDEQGRIRPPSQVGPA
ncbi:hypothetical protein [Streptomyces sp. NPDC004629]|uniref:hypothetical protein n=1 Tax=Streptomyces sp. NPDC004629 TaxID=3364705 RepID=UPI00367E262D